MKDGDKDCHNAVTLQVNNAMVKVNIIYKNNFSFIEISIIK